MKPLKLKMTAFGSFAEETIVDFTQIGNGLYLITGDTGAGKTTIFDALVFALYGEASGSNRDVKTFHSDYVDYKKPTSVELNFESGGTKYTISRSIRFRKGEKDKIDDTVILNDHDNAYEKKTEVKERIKEIVGLDKEQFCKIVMLAQGEFRKFIDADSGTRGDILGVLFNTMKYRQFQEVLKLLNTKIKKQKEQLDTKMELIMKSFENPEDITEEEKKLYDVFHSDLILNLEKLIEKDKAEFETATDSRRKNEEARREAENKRIIAQNQNKELEIKEKAQNDLNEHLKKKDETDRMNSDREKNEKALHSVYPTEDKYNTICQRTEKINADLTDVSAKQQYAAKELESATNAKTEADAYHQEIDKLSEIITTITNLLPDYQKQDE